MDKLKHWWWYKNQKCAFCDKDLFRFKTPNTAASHGGLDIDVGGKKRTVYLCWLCYHLFKHD